MATCEDNDLITNISENFNNNSNPTLTYYKNNNDVIYLVAQVKIYNVSIDLYNLKNDLVNAVLDKNASKKEVDDNIFKIISEYNFDLVDTNNNCFKFFKDSFLKYVCVKNKRTKYEYDCNKITCKTMTSKTNESTNKYETNIYGTYFSTELKLTDSLYVYTQTSEPLYFSYPLIIKCTKKTQSFTNVSGDVSNDNLTIYSIVIILMTYLIWKLYNKRK